VAWRWNPDAYRYYNEDNGQFIKFEVVMSFVDQSILGSHNAMETMGYMVSDGMLSPMDWHQGMRAEIKREYIRQYILGIGGLDQMTQADWGSIGGMLKEQYGWLNGFTDQLGELSEKQIIARSAMYSNSAREAFERAHSRTAAKWGADEELWVLDPAADNCPDCVELSLMGWQPIDTFKFPGQGATQCLTNCKCSKIYRNSVTGEEWEQ